MLIRDLERKTGLDRATVRFYEKEGLIAHWMHNTIWSTETVNCKPLGNGN